VISCFGHSRTGNRRTRVHNGPSGSCLWASDGGRPRTVDSSGPDVARLSIPHYHTPNTRAEVYAWNIGPQEALWTARKTKVWHDRKRVMCSRRRKSLKFAAKIREWECYLMLRPLAPVAIELQLLASPRTDPASCPVGKICKDGVESLPGQDTLADRQDVRVWPP